MKKLLVLLDTDEERIISRFQKIFLKGKVTIITGQIKVFEVDKENNIVRKI